MGWTSGIDAITLFVNDLDASKAFYRSVFDLPVMFEDEASAVFNFESSVVNLLKRSEAPELIDSYAGRAERRRLWGGVHPRRR